MKISCQSCQSKYNVADDKVQGKIVKIRCRKCGATIVVNASAVSAGNGSSPAPAPSAAMGEAAAGEWHVSVSDSDQRTMTLADLVTAYNSGVVTQETFVWTEGMGDWKPLAEVDAVVAALHEAAAAAQAGVASPAVEYARRSAPPAAVAAEAYEAPVAAPTYARPQTGGAFAPQNAAAAAAALEPRRAAVKREARGRDLFATRTGEELQMGGSAASDDARLTGQRNENSVLFSLDHLTKNAEPEPVPAYSPSGPTKDDSGLIDLKALAAKAESMRPPTMHEINAPPALGVAPPLGFSSPLGAPLGGFATGTEAQPKSRLPLIIGGGAGVALLLVMGIVIGLKIGGAATPTAMPSASAFVLPPLPSATAEPSATASATAQASASAAPVAAKPKPVGGGGAWKPGGVGGGAKPGAAGGTGATGATGGASTSAAGGTATGAAGGGAAPPKKGDCGCNGDLLCMMKCSTH